MRKLTKNHLKVQNIVRRKVNLQTLAPKKQNMEELTDQELLSLPSVIDSNNTLSFIYSRFLQLPNLFREKVCEECNYSVPTFYRKVKGEEKALSNAEREKFMSIEKELLRDTMRKAGMWLGD